MKTVHALGLHDLIKSYAEEYGLGISCQLNGLGNKLLVRIRILSVKALGVACNIKLICKAVIEVIDKGGVNLA